MSNRSRIQINTDPNVDILQNWYGQAILIPQLSSTACMLVKDAYLTEEQRAGCIRITQRSYDRIDGTYGTGGRLTAANVSRSCKLRSLLIRALTFQGRTCNAK